jgi:hypothetical protein
MQHRELMVETELMDELKIISRELMGIFPANFGNEWNGFREEGKKEGGSLRCPPLTMEDSDTGNIAMQSRLHDAATDGCILNPG